MFTILVKSRTVEFHDNPRGGVGLVHADSGVRKLISALRKYFATFLKRMLKKENVDVSIGIMWLWIGHRPSTSSYQYIIELWVT
jgi:hypothetical protein